MIESRWEHGSDHHWILPTETARYPWPETSPMYGNGRFALNAILEMLGCRRLWIPSFYCPDVIAAIPNKRLRLELYAENPLELPRSLRKLPVEDGDVILVQNLYGLRGASPEVPAGVVLVEDHTHDPTSEFAFHSRADYCIASLRKLLPVADGGVAWSPLGKQLPTEPALDTAHVHAAMDRLTGALLKAAYLEGGAIEKETYRRYHLAGESALAKGPISTLLPLTRSYLAAFPSQRWRAARRENFAAFAGSLTSVRGMSLLRPDAGLVAFCATLCFDDPERREEVRLKLIKHRIYPAVLWPLHDASYAIPTEDRLLSQRLLSLHCDHRYNPTDMQRVAEILLRIMT